MRRQRRKALALAAAIAMMMTIPGYSADISEFLTGGSGNQSQDAGAGGLYDGQTQDPSTVQTADYQSLSMAACTDSQTGIEVARAVVPEGYTVNSETIWCGPVQCPFFPAEVLIDAVSPDGSVEMTYESTLRFLHRLGSTINGIHMDDQQEYNIDSTFLTMMLNYMTAAQFCDYFAQNCMEGTSGMTFVLETPLPQEVQNLLLQISQQTKDEMNQLYSTVTGAENIYVDQVETTAAERTYRYTDASGKAKILVVFTAVQGVQNVTDYSNLGMNDSYTASILWTIPARYALMVDEDRYEEGLAAFEAFVSNTTLSDQFKQAMSDLSDRISQMVMEARATTLSEISDSVQSTYSTQMSGSEGTYSAIEGWDDVILDRNDYTLSNGDSVKVDTSFDYVYELSDGNVYATNSVSDEPSGATRLYAN